MKNWIARTIATGLCTGYSPVVPGTVGTIPAWLIAWFLIGGRPIALAIVAIIAFLVSVWSASAAEHVFGHDSRKIVIDEWAGMFVALLFVPFTLTGYLTAFVAFRVFDVVKLPPAAQSEKLPAGWGVTMDDIVAGIQANVATQIVIWVIRRIG